MSVWKVPRLRDHLEDVLEAAERISRYTAGLDRAEFEAAEQTRDAVLRNLEIIAAVSRQIERCFPAVTASQGDAPAVLVNEMSNEMSNVFADSYFEVDPGVVWDTIQRDLPALTTQVRALRHSLLEEQIS
jgi:uncharacterized protein with HEPN domain